MVGVDGGEWWEGGHPFWFSVVWHRGIAVGGHRWAWRHHLIVIT